MLSTMTDDGLDRYLYAQRFYFLAEQCRNVMQKSLAGILKAHDLSHSQHLVLLILRYAGFSGREVISTDIAYLLGLEKHTITGVVDKLVERDLVARARSTTDRRIVHLRLTEAGADLAQRVHRETMSHIAAAPDDVASEFPAMCDLLQKLRNHVADSSDQPGETYEHAFGTLLVEGQDAFAKDEPR